MVDTSNITSGKLECKWRRITGGQLEQSWTLDDPPTYSDPIWVCIQPHAAQPLSTYFREYRSSPSRAEHLERSYPHAGRIAAPLLALASLLETSPLHAETFLGRAIPTSATVTLSLSNEPPNRLEGVAAPELNQKLGRASKDAMQRIVAGKRFQCELTGEQTDDREVGVCYLDDVADICAEITSQGLACDCHRYSNGRYAEYETEKSRTLPFPRYCRVR
ncbi:thermonuclease family protein [Lamprobacter modestohalophilus]|uniref:thermonuclease family protein n=1 Tax=Lamprobacter modestohalophilus TaxID=1064514 RepID=UPI003D18F460